MPQKKNIISLLGTRPQYIKHAVLLPHLQQYFTVTTIDTTQHYDAVLSADIITDLQMPAPLLLDIGAMPADRQQRLEEIQQALEKKLLQEKPAAMIVYGDTDSTMAAARAAKACGCPLIHVEAGERSRNTEMPEENNRIATDQLADLLFCVSEAGVQHLAAENITGNVYLVGDLMKDLLLKTAAAMQESPYPYPYYLATLHRNYTQDNKEKLAGILQALNNLDAVVIFPAHPGTLKKLAVHQLDIAAYRNIQFIAPLTYSAAVQYQKFSKAVITDSGGMQKEAYWLRKKCVTLRKETEWTATLAGNWNTLLYDDFSENLQPALDATASNYDVALYGNGDAGKIIAEKIYSIFK